VVRATSKDKIAAAARQGVVAPVPVNTPSLRQEAQVFSTLTPSAELSSVNPKSVGWSAKPGERGADQASTNKPESFTRHFPDLGEAQRRRDAEARAERERAERERARAAVVPQRKVAAVKPKVHTPNATGGRTMSVSSSSGDLRPANGISLRPKSALQLRGGLSGGSASSPAATLGETSTLPLRSDDTTCDVGRRSSERRQDFGLDSSRREQPGVGLIPFRRRGRGSPVESSINGSSGAEEWMRDENEVKEQDLIQRAARPSVSFGGLDSDASSRGPASQGPPPRDPRDPYRPGRAWAMDRPQEPPQDPPQGGELPSGSGAMDPVPEKQRLFDRAVVPPRTFSTSPQPLAPEISPKAGRSPPRQQHGEEKPGVFILHDGVPFAMPVARQAGSGFRVTSPQDLGGVSSGGVFGTPDIAMASRSWATTSSPSLDVPSLAPPALRTDQGIVQAFMAGGSSDPYTGDHRLSPLLTEGAGSGGGRGSLYGQDSFVMPGMPSYRSPPGMLTPAQVMSQVPTSPNPNGEYEGLQPYDSSRLRGPYNLYQ
jgi:hypothetical protein